MCGIFGVIRQAGSVTRAKLDELVACLAHRGPDHQGGWISSDGRIGLGHRRLSILDLSPQGAQPMRSGSGRYVITYNGEIYNFAALKKELASHGHNFQGGSDTEVILAAFEQWGIDDSLKRVTGMFAFGIWDTQEQQLTIARDRIGEKPLYYGWNGGQFVFGSELAPFQRASSASLEINRDALTQLLRFGFIPVPHSIYRGVFKLPPGTTLKVRCEESQQVPACFSPHADRETPIAPRSFWSLNRIIQERKLPTQALNEAEVLRQFETLLSEVIKQQMVADVPLGAFLSGGVDSSAIVALMQRFATSAVRTFSIGFREREFDEAGYARAVARHLGTDHTELYLGAEDAIGVIEKLPEIYSEPFGDSSQIPTVLVSRLARQDVTVALSGDGGDELLAGYRRYSWARKLWSYTKVVPPDARGVIARLAYAVTPQQWDKVWAILKPFLPSTLKVARPGYRVHKAASFYSARTFSDLYLSLISVWDEAASAVINGQEPTTVYSSRECWPSGVSAREEMLWLDTVSYLPDDILVKVDRAAMAVGLETRIPLLDHRLVEFVWGLPPEARAHQSESKWLLRRLLLKYIPAELIDRPKMGFGVPIGDWLKGPLRDWAEELLSENRLSREGFFDVALVRQKWSQHLKGERNWQYLLWHLLMFQQWYRHTKTSSGKDL